ncbi:Flp pilus assembly protein, ATPase CpaF [Actinobacteria bacterium IMCC26207]|nr:Flp pilus assembly protein, ATPase CpaF [Actinobacteria bacterium IMCC26207]
MRLLGETEALEASVRRRFAAETGSVNAAKRLAELFAEEAPLLATVEVQSRAHALAVELVGLGPIQMLIDDPAVTDVLVNGPGEVWIERNGRLERSGVIADKDLIARSIERLVGPLGLRADRSNPIVDARLPDGTRVAVVLPPLAVDGPVLAIRRHRADPLELSAFAGPAVVQLLESLVREQLNLVVYGPTGAGKTSLLNALVAGIPPNERVVTIEDVAELRLPGEHVVRLEARPGSAEGIGRTDIRDLVRAALRLRPDRIIVGEVRGAEALDMIWALSTGHDGCFSTCHASSAADAMRRLETMALLGAERLPLEAIRAQITAAIDVFVGVARSSSGGRRVTCVHLVGPNTELQSLISADGTVQKISRSRRGWQP